MNALKQIWPSLGLASPKAQKNLSWTKKGPGRRHNALTAEQQMSLNPRYSLI